ncbi:MAG: hypothetical protein CMQ41_15765 [Gammaproteobacteria bacterium]|nr:hypothetical protein [Gammaproteobacteria bacterium]
MTLSTYLIEILAVVGLFSTTWLLIKGATALRHRALTKEWPKSVSEQQLSLTIERCEMLKEENSNLKDELKKVTLLVLDRLSPQK